MVYKNNLHFSYVQSILNYNELTGVFTWKHRNNFSTEWNARWANKKAGHIRKDGYVSIRINNKLYLAHRLAWLLHYKEWPKKILDHKNQNPSDNRIENIRECTISENGANRKAPINSSTKYKNINLNKKRGKYQVKIKFNNKHYWVGYFNNIDEAIIERDKFLKEIHKDFASY